MDETIFKYLDAALLVLLWCLFAIDNKDRHVRIATLYITSFAAFGANWEFYFREIHQAIHLLVAALGAYALSKRIPRFNLGLLLFLGFVALSLVQPGITDSVAELANIGLIVLVVNFLYLRCWEADRMVAILRYFAITSALLAVFGLLEYAALAERIEGPFSNPNYYGYFVGVGYVAAFHIFRGWRRFVTLAVIGVVILLSGSRAAAAFPIFHTAYLLLASGHWRYKLGALLGAVVVGGIVIGSGAFRFSDTGALSGSDAERLGVYQTAMAMARDHPIVGVGWGRYPDEFSEYAWSSEIVYLDDGRSVDVTREDRRVTHNDFLRILAELGFPAAAFAAWVVVTAALRFWRGEVIWPMLFLPLWAGNLAFSLTHNNLNSVFFWLILLVPFFRAMQSSSGFRQVIKAPRTRAERLGY